MAASTKTQKCPKLSKSFKERLDQLSCPYTEGVDDSWIAELIFKPGEPRIRLLQWLFSKFDSKLSDVLDPQYASVESKMDSRLQRLLYVASTLGLCRYDDVDLIRGVTSTSHQSSFMDSLLDLVCIVDAAEDPQTKALQSPGIVSDAMGLEEQFLQDCTYMDNFVKQEKIDNVFNTKLTLLPPDLQRQIELGWLEQGGDRDRPPKTDLAAIADNAIQLAEDLDRQKQLLHELQNKYKYQEEDASKMEKVARTTSLVLSELSQLITGFSYCYENEMHHWCNKAPPALTQLGPAFKRVYTLLQQFVNLLKGFKSIRSSYTSLSRDASERIHSVGGTHDDQTQFLVLTGESTLEKLEECVEVLDESIQRRDTDLSSTSTLRSSILKT